MKKRVSKSTARKKQKSTPKSPAPSTRLLTAEGWKRLMMKKHRH